MVNKNASITTSQVFYKKKKTLEEEALSLSGPFRYMMSNPSEHEDCIREQRGLSTKCILQQHSLDD